MAVTPVAAVVANAGGTTPVNTISVTTVTIRSGPNRYLQARVHMKNGSASVSSVILNPGAGQQALTFAAGKSNGTLSRIEVWDLVAPQLGTNMTLTATLAAAATSRLVLGAVNYEDVNQAAPAGSGASAGLTNTAPSATVTTGVGELVADAVSVPTSAGTLVADASQAQAYQDVTNSGTASNNERGAGSRETATTTSTVMSWVSTSAAWSLIAGVINEAPPPGLGPVFAMAEPDQWGPDVLAW